MNANERRPPGLCKINLITGNTIEYSIPVREKLKYVNYIQIDIFRYII